MLYDVIIVGAGISGLTLAYRLNKIGKKVLVLEKQNRLGGRAGVETFHGTDILPGAGIGRLGYDKKLLGLAKELGLQTRVFDHQMTYSPDIPYPADLKKTLQEVRRIYNQDPGKYQGQTFRQVAINTIGPQRYEAFLQSNGYTDYEEEDPEETFRTFGIDDNGWNWSKAVWIPWNEMVDKMARQITIHRSSPVESIALCRETQTFSLKVSKPSSKSQLFMGKKVVLATDIEGVRKLLQGNSIYKDICPQPFLRVYAHFDERSSEVMKRLVPMTMVVGTPLYKILPMNPEKGVYMIAYTDNRGALYYKRRDKEMDKEAWAREVEKAIKVPRGSLRIDDIRVFYWKVGTHYFKPLPSRFRTRKEFLKEAQNPFPNMYVIGEGMSQNQGWTEGAMDSVDNIWDHIKKD